MLKTDIKKRKTRSDKFPLTLHPTGQYCKKIKGKLYYFGSDKKLALQRYLEQAAYLHSGKAVPPDFVGPSNTVSNISIMELQNYVRKQIRDKKSANTINNRITAVKMPRL